MSIQKYQWGFSFIQLYIVLVLSLLWSIAMLCVWLEASRKLPIPGWPEVPRGWRSVLALAEAMRQDFAEADIDPYTLTDSQLKDEIRHRLRGSQMALDTPPGTANDADMLGAMAEIVRSNVAWCVAFVIFAALSIALPVRQAVSWLPWLTFFLTMVFAVWFAVMLGRTTGSRLFMMFVWSIVGAAVAVVVSQVLPYDYRDYE
jgi:hypothetical protein